MGSSQRARQRPRRGAVSIIVGGFGELLLTVGVLLLLFVAWQLWWTNLEAEGVQKNALNTVTQEWKNGPAAGEPGTKGRVIPLEGETWGILFVPKFGGVYAKPIAEGTAMEVLDTVGVGHYTSTQMPGEKGNVALAGHRQTHGQVFWDQDKLAKGDQAYIQTKDGIYTYTFQSTTIVSPSKSDVIWPVPGDLAAKPKDSLLTLTTCDPPFSTAMRMITHLKQTDFAPTGDAAPDEIAELVEKTVPGGNN